jgi:abortive infection bacteriophage resistance protein
LWLASLLSLYFFWSKNKIAEASLFSLFIHFYGMPVINYYRFSAYRFPFCIDSNSDIFKKFTTFENLWNLYCFDRKLRLHLMDAIEIIEIALRTTWANTLALSHGSHAYENQDLFKNLRSHDILIRIVDKDIARSHEEFIIHYKEKYTEPQRPPIWAICEILTLGTLSKCYGNLKKRKDRKIIADNFSIDEKKLVSFLRHLALVRNHCAHHARIWNRRFVTEFSFPDSKKEYLNSNEPKKIYNTIVMILHFLKISSPDFQWRNHLINLLNEYDEVEVSRMGFPSSWEDMDIWND